MATPRSLPPVLVVVTGPPGAGTTTVAAGAGAAPAFPVLHKDALKELLYDRLGAVDRAASSAIGAAAIDDGRHGRLSSECVLVELWTTGDPEDAVARVVSAVRTLSA